MRLHARLISGLALAISGLLTPPVFAEDAKPELIEFFEKKVRPVFVERCGECHADGKAKGGFSLASGEKALKGGDSGVAIVPGKPDESFLLEVLSHAGDVKMPPKEKLSDAEIADIKQWVKLGAVWPATKSAPTTNPDAEQSKFTITAEQRAFWSFQPIRDPGPPDVATPGWAANNIDRFILAALERQKLKPSPPADKRTLLRRTTFDITGLPPTPEEIDAFLADESPDAFAKVVDRLLATPQYGERWGRLWLDVARYGEDQAHTFQARMYPNGYRYRDWVVQAFNDDMPYDRFVMEQIAGDALDGPAEKKNDRLTALGYFALGPVYYADAGCAFKASFDELDDRIDTLARGFLGLTIACARCHDHKFDPISQNDYYALAGIFRSTTYREAPLASEEVVKAYDQAAEQIKQQEQAATKYLDSQATRVAEKQAEQLAKYLTAAWKLHHPAPGTEVPKRRELARAADLPDFLLERWESQLAPDNKAKVAGLDWWYELAARTDLPAEPATDGVPTPVAEAAAKYQTEILAILTERDQQQKAYDEAVAAASDAAKGNIAKPSLDKAKSELIGPLFSRRGLFEIPKDRIEKLLDETQKQELTALRAKVEESKKAAPPKYPVAHSITDGTIANMKFLIRGNPNRTGADVPRRFLAILAGDNPPPFSQGSGRLELAKAIASSENPLTARVIVNRLWQHHFGRGIVATPSNFGALGERPTHPELLDYLARHLISQNWSLKSIHREILLSATYRQSSAHEPKNFETDPDNRFLWRMNRRRLEVEQWRDTLLAVSGSLDKTLGGPSGNLAAADYNRRTLYGSVSRHNLDGLLRLFDFPDPNITSEKRTVTVVPLQQLFVLNSDFMVGRAKALANRLANLKDTDDAGRIRQGCALLFGRPATDAEVQLGLEFLQTATQDTPGDGAQKSALSRWEQYAQILLSANELTFVD